jgi:hypothetical protein
LWRNSKRKFATALFCSLIVRSSNLFTEFINTSLPHLEKGCWIKPCWRGNTYYLLQKYNVFIPCLFIAPEISREFYQRWFTIANNYIIYFCRIFKYLLMNHRKVWFTLAWDLFYIVLIWKTQPLRRFSKRSPNWNREFCGSGRPTRYRDSRATWSYTNGYHSPTF